MFHLSNCGAPPLCLDILRSLTARAICENSCRISYRASGFQCHEGVCLDEARDVYNWREMPYPIEDSQGSYGFPQQEKGDARPICCKFSGSDHTVKLSTRDIWINAEIMKPHQELPRRLSELGWILVMKIQSVGQRTITVCLVGSQLIDNRLRINCQANEDIA